MRFKTVLTVSALFAVVLAAALLGPSSDMSDAASQKWATSNCNGMNVEYTDGNDYIVIELDSDPGLGMYDVIIGGKTFAVSGSSGKRVGVDLGEPLDKTVNYMVIATPNGMTCTCVLSYMQFYDVAAVAEPSAGGSVNGHREYRSGEQATLTASSADGYVFDGWYSGETKVSAVSSYTFTVSADVSYSARFVSDTATITFDSNGGSPVASITQSVGAAVAYPANPVREGYTFVGWEPAFPATMPAGGMNLVAEWSVKTYTITFDTLGGSEVAKITQEYGTAVTAPSDPTKEGFTFVKWDREVPKTVPASDMTISAMWAVNVTVDESGKAEVVLDKDTGAFILPAETKTVTVTMDDNVSVAIQDTSALGAGTTVITKVEEIPNTAEVDGTARAYEVTVTKADNQPVTGKMRVTLPYTPEKDKVPAVYWQNGSALEKMRVISHTSDSVTFETTHNSTYVVVAESVSEDSGVTFMLYLCLLMVVGIALSMLVGFNYYRRKA